MAAVVVGARRSPPREVWKVGAAGSPGSGRDGREGVKELAISYYYVWFGRH